MGTELFRRGMAEGSCLEWACIEAPALVLDIHVAYRKAGALGLTTNTFGANQFRLEHWGLHSQVEAINIAGARLAREAANGLLVLGSVGPTGLGAPIHSMEAAREAFARQADALERGGVDVFTCETFGDVAELRAAVLGIRDVTSRPIWAQMTYVPNGKTPLGLTPREVVKVLEDLTIEAIGVNCAVGDRTVQHVVESLSHVTTLPIIARPNGGQPRLDGGSQRYPLLPRQFASLALQLRRNVMILGGCCGTTPEHIAAASDQFEH